MKKPHNRKQNRIDNSSITISAILEESNNLKCIVEEVAGSRFDAGYCNKEVQSGWEALETSSLEADANGYTHFSEKDDFITLTFDTCFLFSCIKGKVGNYHLTWCSSLS